MILLVADVREFRARSTGPAEGVVLEAEMDRRRGPVATLLVQEGTLKTGDSIVMGAIAGKARAMLDERGRRVQEAGPATPVQIMGLSDVPDASELFRVVTSDREARSIAEEQRQVKRESGLVAVGPRSMMDLSQLFATGEVKVLNLILKGDTQGTIEAIGDALLQMQTEEVKINILHSGVGDVTESDVSLAAATKPTVIVGFQVGADAPARRLAADEHIEIRRYDVIYDLLDDVRLTMIGMLESITEESVVGRVEVRALFKSSRIGTIAGCYVLDGRVFRGAVARVRRQGKMIYEGRIDSLRHLKDDVSEMTQGFECGVTIQGFNDLQVGDVVECVEEREIRRSVL
jgi:translation initiation factor IF-2